MMEHILHSRRRGQALVMITLSSIVIFALLGLVVDIGWAHFRQQAAQAAADGAALAAAQAAAQAAAGIHPNMMVQDGMNPNAASSSTCNPVCGSSGIACQDATACPSQISNPPANNLQAGCLYAKTNGFVNGGKQSVMMTGNTTALTGVSTKYWARATVTETETQLFSAILGKQSLTTGATATAAMIPSSGGGGCVYVLKSSGSSVTNSGNALLKSGCGIYINSNSSSAVLMSGSAQIQATNGASVNIVGNWLASGGATITPAPNLGVQPAADPFASMAPPTVGSCTSNGVTLSGSGSQTLNPGVYCGAVTLSGSVALTLNPGLYILKSGITMSGPTSISGSGVTLYAPSGGIALSGTAGINLSAPTSGTWQGVVIYQSRSNSSSSALSGGSNEVLSGLVYMPAASLAYSGSSGSGGQISTLVVNSLTFSGSSFISVPATTAYGGGPAGCPIRLIQ